MAGGDEVKTHLARATAQVMERRAHMNVSRYKHTLRTQLTLFLACAGCEGGKAAPSRCTVYRTTNVCSVFPLVIGFNIEHMCTKSTRQKGCT